MHLIICEAFFYPNLCTRQCNCTIMHYTILVQDEAVILCCNALKSWGTPNDIICCKNHSKVSTCSKFLFKGQWQCLQSGFWTPQPLWTLDAEDGSPLQALEALEWIMRVELVSASVYACLHCDILCDFLLVCSFLCLMHSKVQWGRFAYLGSEGYQEKRNAKKNITDPDDLLLGDLPKRQMWVHNKQYF
jgi:hypothetical protein